jgi:hypothetical protein
MTFDTKFEAVLDTLLYKFATNDSVKVQVLSTVNNQRLKSLFRSVEECLTVGIIFLEGFKEIIIGGDINARVSQKTKEWVASVPHAQSGGRIAGMMATSICSVLEDFIVDAGRTKLTTTKLAIIRIANPMVSNDDNKARTTLLKNIKPSVRADGTTWITALKMIFSFTLTTEESETLIDMITFRNQYVHDPQTAFSKTITGEQLKCWAVATMILCHRVAIA